MYDEIFTCTTCTQELASDSTSATCPLCAAQDIAYAQTPRESAFAVATLAFQRAA